MHEGMRGGGVEREWEISKRGIDDDEYGDASLLLCHNV